MPRPSGLAATCWGGRWIACCSMCCGSFIRHGTLRLTTARGTCFEFGDGTGRRSRSASRPIGPNWRSCSTRNLRSAKPTWTGRWSIEQGSIADFLALAMSQDHGGKPPLLGAAAMARCAISGGGSRNSIRPPARARNVAHHYDLDERLYSLFLDADRQYSCAYFEQPEQSLDDAQLAKKRHIAAKLLLEPATRVLDIGSGWGGLGLYLAEMCGARVTGITLSEEQLALSRERAEEKGLGEPRRVPPAGLSRHRRALRPHRLGRHVRACRRRLLRHVLPQVRRTARRRRRDAAAFDRPLGRSRHHQSVDRQIYFPRRLHPGPLRGAAGGRARRIAGHRHRNPAAALRRDAEALARAVPRAPRGSANGSTTRASCACGSSISRRPRWRSASRA